MTLVIMSPIYNPLLEKAQHKPCPYHIVLLHDPSYNEPNIQPITGKNPT